MVEPKGVKGTPSQRSKPKRSMQLALLITNKTPLLYYIGRKRQEDDMKSTTGTKRAKQSM